MKPHRKAEEWKVYIARKLPEPLEEMLAPHCRVRSNPLDTLEERDLFLKKIDGINGLVTDSRVKVNREVFDAAGPGLRVVSNYAVGYNNIDVAAATQKGILVTNTPGVVTDATADLAWALMFAAARRVGEAERLVRSGTFGQWTPGFMQGMDIFKKTLGIVGAGRIGMAVAARSTGFKMKLVYTDHTANPTLESETGARRMDLDTLLAEADIVSVHTPLTPETRHFMGREQFEQMKPSAILINTSRGQVLDEQALAEALATKTIRAAGLDVFENEPLVTPALLGLDNVVMTPHIGTATFRTRQAMSRMAAENLVDIICGRRPRGLVNPEIWPTG